jgi:signal transduction histidine kinase
VHESQTGTALGAGGAAVAWAGATLLAVEIRAVEALYFPIVVASALFVSPWCGIALGVASVVAVLLMPAAESDGRTWWALALVATSASAVEAGRRQRADERDFARLVAMLGHVSSSLDASAVLSSIVHAAREVTGAKASSLRLLAPDGRTLQVRAVEGLSSAYMDKGTVDIRRSTIDLRVLEGEIVYLRDAATDPRVQYPEAARAEGIASLLSVPLKQDRAVIGVLRVYTGRPRRFSRREVRMLVALAAQAVIALRHAEMHEATLNFMRKAAHELRAPLGAISGVLKVLLEGVTGQLSEKQIELLRRADRRAGVLVGTVTDLLALSRTRVPKPAADDIPVCVQAILEAVVALMRPQADQTGVHVEVQADPNVPHVLGNPDEIEELLSNLVSNAIKYTPRGGRVSASVTTTDSSVVVRVADTGIGIPREELPRLFEEFHRCANARRSDVPGTGLGMAIVKAIADRHRANVHVESEEGRGTVVEVVFPSNRG